MPSVVRLAELVKRDGKCDVMPDGSVRMKRGRLPSMIVLCPTRELARQVEGELNEVARPLGLFTSVFHGGVSYDPQVSPFCCRWSVKSMDVVVCCWLNFYLSIILHPINQSIGTCPTSRSRHHCRNPRSCH